MFEIWKYTLKAETEQQLELPFGARILSVKEQGGFIVLYALVNPREVDKAIYSILVYGTGHTINVTANINTYDFLDTVKMENGLLMFHVFYKHIQNKQGE